MTNKKAEVEIKKALMVALAIFMVISSVACAITKQKQVEQQMKQPNNCTTAEGNIRTDP